MQNGIFKLGWGDFVKGLVMVVYGALLTFVYNIVVTSGFDVATLNWSIVGHQALNVGIISAVVYLFKNFTTTDSGKVVGIVPTE